MRVGPALLVLPHVTGSCGASSLTPTPPQSPRWHLTLSCCCLQSHPDTGSAQLLRHPKCDPVTQWGACHLVGQHQEVPRLLPHFRNPGEGGISGDGAKPTWHRATGSWPVSPCPLGHPKAVAWKSAGL